MTATKAPARRPAAARKAAKPRAVASTNGVTNGDGAYEPPTEVRAPEEFVVAQAPEPHPVYGAKQLYVYQPKDGSAAIEWPHISTCQPTPLFFYDHRNQDQMHQAFAWMDLCGIPTAIGRRLFMLPEEEQATLLREWFAGLNLTPAQGVSPPGES